MNEYQVSDYAIFSKASDTNKNYITKIENSSTAATECKTILSSEDVFMGPVVIQVIGSKSKGTRHYVTAVGFKNNVTSGSQLKDTDLLIVDSYDGNVENIVAKGSSGDGRYIIKGTDTSNYKKRN